MRRLCAALLLLLASVSAALAQSTFNTPSGAYVPGSVVMCDNGAVPVSISATGTTAATAATLPATSGKTTYLCGFSITAAATLGTTGTATLTGPIGGTMSFIQPVGLLSTGGQLPLSFNPCLPASATNTAFVLTSAATGLGGVTAVNAWGFQL
jgi:hypothetical protein